MKLGAFDYLSSRSNCRSSARSIDRALAISRLMQVPAVVTEAEVVDDRIDAIVGPCPAMHEVYKEVGRVAGQDVTVLITGETGTGKELVARAIYQHSRRSGTPFLRSTAPPFRRRCWRASCSATRKGAFTGADRQRIGKFEQCARRHPLPRRNRRHDAADAEPRSCVCCRSSNSSASAATRP